MAASGRCWVLKTPHHLEYLDVILAVFRDVSVVQTHRDPKKSIPSFCSMVAHATGLWSDRVDPQEIAAHWMRKTLRMIERSMNVRKTSPDGVFVDVLYRDLVADPIGALRTVYRSAGIDFTEAAENAARKIAARDVKDRHGSTSMRPRFRPRRPGHRRGVRLLPAGVRDPRREQRVAMRRIIKAVSGAIGDRYSERPTLDAVPTACGSTARFAW